MQPLLLLHGAIGASDQLQPLAAQLSNRYKVYTMDFSGHGHKPFPEGDFSIGLFAGEVLAFLDEHAIERVNIFGYSMGGYVAMQLAARQPDRIEKVVTLATKFHWDEETALRELKMLDAGKIEAKLPAFAEALQQRHRDKDWKEVLQRTGRMLEHMGRDNPLKPDDYKAIQTRCLLLLGDRDKMVSLQETSDVFRLLPNAQMGMLPGTPHPMEQVDAEVLAYLIGKFVN